MSSSIIKDGGGSGRAAKVDSKQRLSVSGEALAPFEQAVIDGRGFLLTSGIVNLTSANESAVLYMKNNGDKDLILVESRYFMGTSTGGTSPDFQIKGAINPTSGTIQSSTLTAAGNLNLGSAATVNIDARIGGEGITCITAVPQPSSVVQTGQIFAKVPVSFPKGTSLCLTVKPPTGNTSVDVALDIIFYELEL